MSSDLQVSMILKLVDQVTAPARAVKSTLQEIGGTSERVGRAGLEWSNQQIAANQARQSALMGEAFAVTALVGSVGAMLSPAINFEKAMDGVGAVSKASTEELALMTETARNLGADTNWGATEAAEGMKFLAMAGFETNEIVEAMPGMLNLASAGATDLGRASDIASNILTGFGLEASEMIRVADVMTNTFTSSNTDVAMLGETMKYVAPVANSLGIGLEEVAAMAGKLGDAGIQGSQAGTGLRAMMSRLAAPTKEARKALNALGVDTLDANGNMRDFYTILTEIDAGLDKFGTGEQQDMIAAIAGLEAASAATVLLDQAGSGALLEYAQALRETGSAARVANEMNDNTAGALKRMQSVTESLAISVGAILLPEIAEMLETIRPMIRAVQMWAEANPELVSTIARIVAGLVAFKVASIVLRFALFGALGPILQFVRAGSLMLILLPRLVGAFLSLLNPMALVRGAMVALKVAFISTGIGALIAGIAMAGVWIYNNWSGLQTFFVALWQGFRDALGPAAPILDGIIAAVQSLWNWLSDLLGPLDASKADWASWGTAVGQSLGNTVVYITELPGRIAEGLSGAWTGTKAWIAGMWADLDGAALKAWEALKSLLLSYTPAGLIYTHWDGLAAWVSTMWPDLSGAATAAWDLLKAALLNYTPAGLLYTHWDGLAAWVTTMWPDLSGVATSAWETLKTVLASYTPAGLIYTHWEGIAEWFKELWASLPSIDWDAMINLDGIKEAWTAVTDWFGAAAAGLWDLLPEMPEWNFGLFGGDDQIEDPKTLLAAAKAAEELERQFPALSAAAQTVLTEVQAILRAISEAMAAMDLSAQGAAITLSIAAGMLSQLDAVRKASAQIGAAIQAGLPRGARVAVDVQQQAVQGYRDSGGPVMAGLPYMVGERGRELFVPDVAGKVVPTSALNARIDRRPMLAAHRAATQIVRQGDNVQIHIAPPPGVDPQEIARMVSRELDRRQRMTQGGLHDGEDWDA